MSPIIPSEITPNFIARSVVDSFLKGKHIARLTSARALSDFRARSERLDVSSRWLAFLRIVEGHEFEYIRAARARLLGVVHDSVFGRVQRQSVQDRSGRGHHVRGRVLGQARPDFAGRALGGT